METVPAHAVGLVLVNDAWFAHASLVEAAYHYARIMGWWYGKKIVYVSFYKEGCF